MAVSKLGLEGDSVLPKGRRSTSKGPSRLSIRVPMTTLDQGMRPPWGSKVPTSKNIPRAVNDMKKRVMHLHSELGLRIYDICDILGTNPQQVRSYIAASGHGAYPRGSEMQTFSTTPHIAENNNG